MVRIRSICCEKRASCEEETITEVLEVTTLSNRFAEQTGGRMSIPKVVGIEEEYAIQMQGGHGLTPFQASCLLVNAYARKTGLRDPGTRFIWDYGHETPFDDFRGTLFRKSTGQEIISDDENIRINAALPNGARLYTDHAHPE